MEWWNLSTPVAINPGPDNPLVRNIVLHLIFLYHVQASFHQVEVLQQSLIMHHE
jgi:hypothetical protein